MKEVWKDPVWSSVIAGVILTVILSVGQYFFGLLGYISIGAGWVWSTFNTKIPIPLWLLIIGIPVLLLLVPVITKLLLDKEPNFTKYTCDHILGIDYSWKWNPPNKFRAEYRFDELTPRCPTCKSVLNIDDYDGRLVFCINDSCKWQWPLASQRYAFHHPAHRSDAIDHSSKVNERVMKEIDRKLHTGEWENG
ncbi:hypothetical protein [Idiomarina abyssalis]|uniref:hypothetical protein n=1 Tax=Idiomarina abyssalis TaxID=86102 RepID=UPI003A95BD94